MNHRTALHSAARVGSLQVLELLLEARGEVNALDRRGQAPLHFATGAVARRLLEAGAEVDLQDHSGATPLFTQPGAAEVFLQGGASWELRNRHGETAMHAASRPLLAGRC